jgi:hypothetical protein
MKNRINDETEMIPVRRDLESFSVWGSGTDFRGRLRFDGMDLNEDALSLRFWCQDIQKSALLHSGNHLLFKYANESANFLEFGQLPIHEHRMWVAESSDWLNEVSKKSGGAFDGVVMKHFLFVFSNASIEMICLGEPEITVDENYE